MEYVMVPVPEEFVAEVTQYLQWNTGSIPPDLWDEEGIVRFVDGLDEQARTLLLHAATCASEIVVLPVHDAAVVAGCTDREVVGLVVELNEAVRAVGGPPFVIATALLHEATPTGPDSWSVNMPSPIAELVLDAVGHSHDPRDQYDRLREPRDEDE